MKKFKIWIVAVVLFPLALIFFKYGAAHINSIANYFITKDVVDQGGGASQSTNFKMVDAIGQPGGVGSASSTNFKESSGFFSGGDVTQNPVATIFPIASLIQSIGSEFWVDIIVGDSTTPVSDLFGVSFDLNFTNTAYLDVVTPHASNVISGSFIGNDVVFIQTIDETAGKVSIGISRKAGDGGVSGFGTVARIKFVSNTGTPDGTDILFSLSGVSANDPNGAAIALGPQTLTVTLSGLIVWPGDTNNEGIVNQADVLPLGLFWGSTGPPRPGASIAWTGQSAPPWTPENGTYADANGDGTVNQADVLPIGLNWGKTHAPISSSADEGISEGLKKPNAQTLKMNITGNTKQNQTCWVEFVADGVIDLFGISFEMVYSPITYIDSVVVEDGSWLGDDILFFPNVDMTNGKVSLGITRKAGQGSKSGSGIIATIRMKLKDIPPVETALTMENVVAIDEMGNTIQFDLVNHTITEVEEETVEIIPTTFTLFQNYPNPFNPKTTISYQLPVENFVELTIYNVLGEKISTLVSEKQQPGNYKFEWDAKNLESGVYIYRLKSENFIASQKLLLLK